MKEEKIMFIIPGFRYVVTSRAYRDLASILKSEGYLPVLVKIPWRKNSILENIEYFLERYNHYKFQKKYILGFSLGAMIAFIASTKVKVAGLILCSLSPYFKEDLKSSKFSYKTIAKKTKARQILMLYGAKEAKSLIKRVNEAFQRSTSEHKYLIPIQKAEHNIGDKKYLNKISQIAKVLN